MTQTDSFLIHKCKYCNYQTNRNFNIKRHNNTKHIGIKELNISEGEGTIMLIFQGKNIKIGEKFQINDILAEKIRKIP